MKNTFLKTAAGLFAAILLGAFVLSCEGPAGSNGSSGTIIPQVTQIADAGAYYAVGYDTVRLVSTSSTYTVQSDDSIPDGKTLLVAAGVVVTVDTTNPLTIGENATLQLEDGAGIILQNDIARGTSVATTKEKVVFLPGAKIAGSEGVESISAGANGGALLLKEYFSSITDGTIPTGLAEVGTADASLWSAGGKIAFAESTNNAGLLTTSKSQTDGEELGTGENDLSASNGLAIAEGGTAIAASGIVAEGVLSAPSARDGGSYISTHTLADIFAKADPANKPELVITNLQLNPNPATGDALTYAATTELQAGITVYVPTGKVLYLTNEVVVDTAKDPSGKAGTAVVYDIKGDIKVSGSVMIGGRSDAIMATIADGGNIGAVTVKGTGNIELVKDANGTQLGGIGVFGADGGIGDASFAGGNGGDVMVLVGIDGYVSKVFGGNGGTNGDTATKVGGNGGRVFVKANVNGSVTGGVGAEATPTAAGEGIVKAGDGGAVHILEGNVIGSTVATLPGSIGSLAGGAGGDNHGTHTYAGSGAGAGTVGVAGLVYAARSEYVVNEAGDGVVLLDTVIDGKEIALAKGIAGASVGGAGGSASGGDGGKVVISGEATYIILP